jgi:hypothetical protein
LLHRILRITNHMVNMLNRFAVVASEDAHGVARLGRYSRARRHQLAEANLSRLQFTGTGSIDALDSIVDRRIDHVAEQSAVILPLARCLDEQDREHLLRWIDPKSGTREAAPVVLSDRARSP